MPIEKIDYFFPFFVFFYGVFMVFVNEFAALQFFKTKAKQAHLSPEQMKFLEGLLHTVAKHRSLAFVCFWVGGLWSLQSLIY